MRVARPEVRLWNATRAAVTADNSLSVYWEHVVAVTDDGCEVLDLRTGRTSRFTITESADRSGQDDDLRNNRQRHSRFQ
jgi:hypothetical protein